MHTPHFDAFSKTAVRFTRAYSVAPHCLPSRNAYMTGRKPDTSQVWSGGGLMNFRTVGPDWDTLPSFFRDRGYVAVGQGKVFHEYGNKPAPHRPAAGWGRTEYVHLHRGVRVLKLSRAPVLRHVPAGLVKRALFKRAAARAERLLPRAEQSVGVVHRTISPASVVLLAGEPQSQVTTVLLLTMLSLVWHVLAAPYVARVTDTLETLSLLIQTGTLVLAQVRGAVWPYESLRRALRDGGRSHAAETLVLLTFHCAKSSRQS